MRYLQDIFYFLFFFGGGGEGGSELFIHIYIFGKISKRKKSIKEKKPIHLPGKRNAPFGSSHNITDIVIFSLA